METDSLIDFKELQAVLEEFADRIAEEYKANLVRDGRPASGKLMNSISTRVVMGQQEWLVVMNLEDYWKYIENGTRGRKTGKPDRKFPPLNKILEWVNIKPNLPRPAELTPEQFARKIAGKIMWYGTKGKPSLEDAKKSVIEEFRDRISEALGHDMTNYIRKLVKN